MNITGLEQTLKRSQLRAGLNLGDGQGTPFFKQAGSEQTKGRQHDLLVQPGISLVCRRAGGEICSLRLMGDNYFYFFGSRIENADAGAVDVEQVVQRGHNGI